MNVLAHDETAIKYISIWVGVYSLSVAFAVAAMLSYIPATIVVLEAPSLQVHLVGHADISPLQLDLLPDLLENTESPTDSLVRVNLCWTEGVDPSPPT